MYTKSPARSVATHKTQLAPLPPRHPAFDPSTYVTRNLPLDDVVKLK